VPRWDTRRRLTVALELLDDERLDTLCNAESSFRDLPSALHRLAEAPGDVLCHRVRYDAP
jgi:hypothetical protein